MIHWSTSDLMTVRLYAGDVRTALNELRPKSVHCVVTSPPYWGLRDYGVEGQLGSEPSPDCGTQGKAQCGECFVCNMVAVFRGVWRILRDDGTLWLNLGDSYASGGAGNTDETWSDKQRSNAGSEAGRLKNRPPRNPLPSGNLVGVPWRVALALQTDGWILRQDIVWAKPSPMPESVTNRCTKAHEYVFLLTKGMDYYYDGEAIKAAASQPRGLAVTAGKQVKQEQLGRDLKTSTLGTNYGPPTSNKRSVWSANESQMLLGWLMANAPEVARQFLTDAANKPDVWNVSSHGYPGAHFATYPPKLIEPMILAGTSERGACFRCGSPWGRVVEKEALTRPRPNDYVKRTGEAGTGNSCANTVAGVDVTTVGWAPTCACETTKTVPCVVLDPFVGAGTTAVVAVRNGRRCVGVDLSAKYLDELAAPRVEAELLKSPRTIHLCNSAAEAFKDVGMFD